jgi:UDP:flavonoid glycosyltransferase YjiC (YdhE family)
MRVILTAFGTTGDNAPMIALAEALRAQGDEPLLLLNPLYAATVAARALPYRPVGTRWDPEEVTNGEKYLDPFRGALAIWDDLYLPSVAPTFHAVRQAIAEHRADLVVSHWMTFGGHFAARQAGVRNAVVTHAIVKKLLVALHVPAEAAERPLRCGGRSRARKPDPWLGACPWRAHGGL